MSWDNNAAAKAAPPLGQTGAATGHPSAATASDTAPLLSVEHLHVAFKTRRGVVDAVRDVSFTLAAGQTLGIVGESGSGKSVTAYAVTHLLETSGRIAGGTIRFRGADITKATWKTLRSTHGASISMIFQNPRAALNPIRRIGVQIMDALRTRGVFSAADVRAKAIALLSDVLIRDPEKRFDAYPHELSGGMCQRVMIAIAIASEPMLLIADEPTTGLDVTTQKTVMDLLAAIIRARGMSMILITHDLGLAARYCDGVAVMQHGRIVESAPPLQLFHAPRAAYTRRLVAASPTPTSHVADLVVDGAGRPAEQGAETGAAGRPVTEAGALPLLEVQGLAKRYGHGTHQVNAVDGVSFRIGRGESVGLVGESGSGKSTLSRLICRLVDKTEGSILFDGASIGDMPARFFHGSSLRRDIQLVFQDPNESLNPRFTAFDCIAHPLRRLEKIRDAQTLRTRVTACAVRVGLPVELLSRFPHQLSGGQKARVGIARAIACSPRLLVLDEPTAALDVSVQAVILQLLDRLRREEGLAYLFVSHDLNVVRMMCEYTIVLRHGEIVEAGTSAEVFTRPRSAYTQALLAAIPNLPQASAAPAANETHRPFDAAVSSTSMNKVNG